MESNIYISAEEKLKVNETDVESVVNLLSESLNFSVESLEINFVSNDTILEINKKHLDHHYFTDIITFNYSGENDNLDGEIFISYDEAVENAKRFDCEVNIEVLRLIIHGILHLVGFDDIKDEDKIVMKQKEDEFVEKFRNNFTNEFVCYEN